MKFEYNLIWNNEILDTASTKKEAIRLKQEYQLAFKTGSFSSIQIKRVRAIEWKNY